MMRILFSITTILLLVSCSISKKNFDDTRVPAATSYSSLDMALIFFQYSQTDKAPERLARLFSDNFNRLQDSGGNAVLLASATAVDEFADRNERIGTIKIIYKDGKRDLALQVQKIISENIKPENEDRVRWTVMFVDKPDQNIRRGDMQVMIF